MRALLLSLLLSGCAKRTPQEADPIAPSVLAVSSAVDPSLLGTWDLDGSTTVWTIETTPGGVQVSGIDAGDGEPFEISNVRPNGHTLRFSTRMPSTDHSTVQTWTLTEDGTCSVLVQGSSAVTLEATRRD